MYYNQCVILLYSRHMVLAYIHAHVLALKYVLVRYTSHVTRQLEYQLKGWRILRYDTLCKFIISFVELQLYLILYVSIMLINL